MRWRYSTADRAGVAVAQQRAASAGLSDLQALTELAQELAALLLWREVQEIAAR